jgi:hypothetical protein
MVALAAGSTIQFKGENGAAATLKFHAGSMNLDCGLSLNGQDITADINAVTADVSSLRTELANLAPKFDGLYSLVCPAKLGENQVHSLDGARTRSGTNGVCKYDCAADHHDADADGTCVRCKVATDCAVGELFDGGSCGTDTDESTCTPCTTKPDDTATYTTAGSCDYTTLAPTKTPTAAPTGYPTESCSAYAGSIQRKSSSTSYTSTGDFAVGAVSVKPYNSMNR